MSNQALEVVRELQPNEILEVLAGSVGRGRFVGILAALFIRRT